MQTPKFKTWNVTTANTKYFVFVIAFTDRLCGLVIRIPGYRSRGPGSIPEVVGLERGPLSLVSTTEELPGRKSSGSGLETREYETCHVDHATPSIRKSWH
jgi:hypothetical protein